MIGPRLRLIQAGMRRFPSWSAAIGLLLFLAITGCTTAPSAPRHSGNEADGTLEGLPPNARLSSFCFATDTYSFANELVWDYSELQHDTPSTNAPSPQTAQTPAPKEPYTQRCFVLTRTARQFFWYARFAPNAAPVTESDYRARIHAILQRDARRPEKLPRKVVLPGYPNLKAFSRDWEHLLKEEGGGSWQSYLQRGNWRMILPFSRRHQRKTAGELIQAIDADYPPIVHLVRFPHITINHALLVTGYRQTGSTIVFQAYDPNQPEEPARLVYDQATRTFRFPRTFYFGGGPVDVYQVYCGWLY